MLPKFYSRSIAFLSVGVATYAVVAYTAFPLGSLVHPKMKAVFQSYSLVIYCHIFASAVALALGPWQFSNRLRTSRPELHRFMGRVYLGVGILLGGVAGLFMAFHAFGGPVSQSGFGTLAMAWLFTGLRAYSSIRRGDVPDHKRWMIRNFALTLGAVTLRLYLPLSMVLNIPFATAYPAIAWLAWVPNLLLAEYWIRRHHLGSSELHLSQETAG